ncbi:MAG TPA: hypothetical protein VKQ54_16230 [Caulobacteraceae bacterium]|nr:hypothetical protein [Caulobacteraceae bacterium]
MSFTDHTQCVAPKDYSGPFIGSGGMTATIVIAILSAIFYPGALTLTLIVGGIGYCRWWLYGRLVCLGGDRCIIGLPLGVYSQANAVGFLGKFDTDFSADILLAPSLLTDSIQDVAAKNALQGHMIQDQRFANNPANPLAGDLATMYANYSNLAFTGEAESPADLVGAAGQIDQDNNLNIGGQGVLTPAQGDSLGLAAPGSLNAQGLVVPNFWEANTFHIPGDQVSDSNGALQMCTTYSEGLSGASEPAWAGLISISAWSLPAPGTSFTFTASNSNAVGDTILLSDFRTSLFFNKQLAKVTAASPSSITADVTPLAVGSEAPTVGSFSEGGSGLTLGALTMDNAIQWSAQGPPPSGPGTFEIEFEGSGVWDLYQALLTALPAAGFAAAVCWIPVVGWIICLVASLVAIAIVGIGALIAQNDTPTVTVSGGTIHPGQDVLFVRGRWVMDSAHTGWNELHPVIAAQKIGTVDHANVVTGDPWIGTDFADPVKLKTKLDAMCDLTAEAVSTLTANNQAQPQNQWTLHPLVDGCTQTPPPPVIK